MHLESARALKAQALERVIRPLRATSARRRTLAYSAGPMRALDATPRLLAVGISPAAGGEGYQLAVRLQRRGLAESEEIERLRKMAKNEIDVRFVGRVSKRATGTPWHREHNRPLRIGGSVGHFNITAGTLGGFVTSRGKSDVLILSNNHVLADENRCAIGDAVLQPGPIDGGKKGKDQVAKLHKFVALSRTKPNVMDCATAKLLDGIEWDVDRLTGLGRLAGLSARSPDPGLRVAKVGRTTGLTRGRISAFELDDLAIVYDMGNIIFNDSLEIESTTSQPFSDLCRSIRPCALNDTGSTSLPWSRGKDSTQKDEAVGSGTSDRRPKKFCHEKPLDHGDPVTAVPARLFRILLRIIINNRYRCIATPNNHFNHQ